MLLFGFRSYQVAVKCHFLCATAHIVLSFLLEQNCRFFLGEKKDYIWERIHIINIHHILFLTEDCSTSRPQNSQASRSLRKSNTSHLHRPGMFLNLAWADHIQVLFPSRHGYFVLSPSSLESRNSYGFLCYIEKVTCEQIRQKIKKNNTLKFRKIQIFHLYRRLQRAYIVNFSITKINNTIKPIDSAPMTSLMVICCQIWSKKQPN